MDRNNWTRLIYLCFCFVRSAGRRAGSQKRQQEVKLGPVWPLCSESINDFSICRRLSQELPENRNTSDRFIADLLE